MPAAAVIVISCVLFGAAAASAVSWVHHDLRPSCEEGLLDTEEVSLLQRGIAARSTRRGAHNASAGECASSESLLFLHIPKTAGTVIEELALQQGIKWGANMSFDGCGVRSERCPAWHLPPASLPAPTIYDGREVFCVVRDPFDRLVSEYGHMVAHQEYAFDYADLIQRRGCAEEGLNEFLLSALGRVEGGETMLQLCHFVPQSDYIWGPEGTSKPWCTDIIRYENLDAEFNALMERKGYSLRMGEERVNQGACPSLTAQNLSQEVRRLARVVYFRDFDALNYSMNIGS